MRGTIFATAVVLSAIGVLPSAAAQSNTFTVDCSRGQKLATALAQGDFRKPLVINVRGTCSEFVTITRDNVTLRGDPAAELVAPTQDSDLVIIEAKGVTLENLTLTGGAYGVRNNQSFSLMITKCVIQGTRSDGVRGFVGDARLVETTVQNAGGAGVYLSRGASAGISQNSRIVDNAGAGVLADRNSTVVVTATTISGNGSSGVQLQNGSYGSFGGSTISENGGVGLSVGPSSSTTVAGTTISGNGTGDGPQGDGIMLWGGSQGQISGSVVVTDNRDEGIDVAGAASAYIFGAEVARNGGNGILGYMGANLVLGDLVIENNAIGVFCAANCTAQMENMAIHGNAGDGINLSFDSTLMLVGPPIDVTDNGGWGLYCHDAESSVTETGLVSGTVSPTCTGFD